MARVFSAVDIEDEKLLDKLEEIRDRLDLGFNPVDREKMHITIEFFSDIDQDEINTLKETIENTDIGKFKAEIKGIGAFPSEDFIRVLWAGAEAEEFRDLHEQITDHEVESDSNHHFKPHITLMRVENVSEEDKRKLQRMIREYREDLFGELKVDKIKLFESKLEPNGARYEKIYEKSL